MQKCEGRGLGLIKRGGGTGVDGVNALEQCYCKEDVKSLIRKSVDNEEIKKNTKNN